MLNKARRFQRLFASCNCWLMRLMLCVAEDVKDEVRLTQNYPLPGSSGPLRPDGPACPEHRNSSARYRVHYSRETVAVAILPARLCVTSWVANMRSEWLVSDSPLEQARVSVSDLQQPLGKSTPLSLPFPLGSICVLWTVARRTNHSYRIAKLQSAN